MGCRMTENADPDPVECEQCEQNSCFGYLMKKNPELG